MKVDLLVVWCTLLALWYDLMVLFYPQVWWMLIIMLVAHCLRQWENLVTGLLFHPQHGLFFVEQSSCENLQVARGRFTGQQFHDEHSVPSCLRKTIKLPLSMERVVGSRGSASYGKAAIKRQKWNFSWKHHFHHNWYNWLTLRYFVWLECVLPEAMSSFFLLNVNWRCLFSFLFSKSPALLSSTDPCSIHILACLFLQSHCPKGHSHTDAAALRWSVGVHVFLYAFRAFTATWLWWSGWSPVWAEL